MTQFRFARFQLLTLLLALVHTPAAWSQGRTPAVSSSTPSPSTPSRGPESAVKTEASCAIFALKDFGDDPKLGEWIAATIPQVIQPGSWNEKETKHKITYYAQGKVLVVYHNADVHAEVRVFLDGIKKALPQEKEKAATNANSTIRPLMMLDPKVSPASLNVPATMPAVLSSSYPVPLPLQHPKHLFHMIVRAEGVGDLGTTGLLKDLTGVGADTEDAKDQAKAEVSKTTRSNPSVTFILRYEGEGIIDNTVADVLKEIYGQKNAAKCEPGISCAPGLGSVIGAYVNAPPAKETRLPVANEGAVPTMTQAPDSSLQRVPVPPLSAPSPIPPAPSPPQESR